MFEFYDDGHIRYLQLHDNHTLWNINCDNFDCELYNIDVSVACQALEKHYKDLDVYVLGRSGRHICVDDTPINRRRYHNLVDKALKYERLLIDWWNKN